MFEMHGSGWTDFQWRIWNLSYFLKYLYFWSRYEWTWVWNDMRVIKRWYVFHFGGEPSFVKGIFIQKRHFYHHLLTQTLHFFPQHSIKGDVRQNDSLRLHLLSLYGKQTQSKWTVTKAVSRQHYTWHLLQSFTAKRKSVMQAWNGMRVSTVKIWQNFWVNYSFNRFFFRLLPHKPH